VSVSPAALTISLGAVGVPQADVIESNVHLGASKEVSSWELILQNWNGKYSPGGVYPLNVGQDGYICIGRGATVPQIITTRTESIKFESTPLESYVTVSGRCWGEKLFRYNVNKDYSSYKGEAIVKDILDYYAGISHVRSSVELVENTDTTFNALKVQETQAWDILRRIAADSDKAGVIGFDFRIAPDGKCEFFARGSKTSTVSLSEKIELAEYSKDITAVRNKVTMYGAADKSSPLDKDETVESLTPASGNWSATAGTLSVDNAQKFSTAASSIKNATGAVTYGASLFTYGSAQNLNVYPKIVLALARDAAILASGFRVHLYDTSARQAIRTLPGVGEVTDWTVFSLDVGADHAGEWNLAAGFDWTAVNAVRIDAFLVSSSTSGNFWVGQLYFGGARYSNLQ
jgi:hypothetical protein